MADGAPPTGNTAPHSDAPPAGNTTPHSNAAICNVTTGVTCDDEHIIDIDTEVWVGYREEPSVKGASPSARAPSIPRVRRPIKNYRGQNQILSTWYKPILVTIGPYHSQSKDEQLQEGKNLKPRHAQKFIAESEQSTVALYRRIKERVPEFRKLYDDQRLEKLNFDDRRLATIFLLDGCFLLNFINCSRKEDGFAEFGLTNYEVSCIKQDLFLVENQIPYEVLKFLFMDAEPSNPPMEEKIRDFVASHVPFPRGSAVAAKEVIMNTSPLHLLHYLQCFLLGKPESISPPQKQGGHGQRGEKGRRWDTCRNVQELTKVGIHVKPSPTSFLTDVSFKPHLGATACLMLPALSMNNSTMNMFLNLIAFESSRPPSKLRVISYLCFLDSLIDRWEDVKELQDAGVLCNILGEQGDVAHFFNIVCSKLVPDPYAYRDVIEEIESHIYRHGKSKPRKWYLQCKQKYFSSPWSLIALIAAIIGLSLTAIQAFTSLFPR